MFTVVVNFAVRPEHLDEFVAGIKTNARSALADEPGCLRFEVNQQIDDPTRFVLYEEYADEDAFYRGHRTSPHYAAWRKVAERCVLPNGQVATFCRPVHLEEEPA
jgi:autoinducer 2-degrading protein